jgi:thiosulfate reductase cytochrome b subunit
VRTIVPKPLRVIGIILCGLALLVPQAVCFSGARPHVLEVMHFISLLSPLTFLILTCLCIDEGRERERAKAERSR